jgi:3'-phosphoadenosine 5'-phosphosulfate (PAPS) 3'-phosphatase
LKCKIKILGSIGVRICSIAEGESDFFVNNSAFPCKWDTAAATIIVQEAGGEITDFYGGKISYNEKNLVLNKSFIVSNSILHDQILKILPENALDMMKSC